MDDLLKHYNFLHGVKDYVTKHPEIAPHVTTFIANGIKAALSDSRERATDMELALNVLLGRNYKGRNQLVLDKIEKWKDRGSVPWNNFMDRIRRKLNPTRAGKSAQR